MASAAAAFSDEIKTDQGSPGRVSFGGFGGTLIEVSGSGATLMLEPEEYVGIGGTFLEGSGLTVSLQPAPEFSSFSITQPPSMNFIWSHGLEPNVLLAQVGEPRFAIAGMTKVPAQRPGARPATAATQAATSEDEPMWWPSVLSSIERLLALQPGWDSYGAPRVNRDVLATAMQVLSWAATKATPAPWIVPTGDGGVQLEWHDQGLDIEVYFIPGDPTAGLFVQDHVLGKATDAQILSDVKALAEALERLNERASAAGEAP